MQARFRRVAVADLVGEVAPLQSLVTGDDAHGIVDSFNYGVSINKIAYPVDDLGNLFILPSGSDAVATPEIYGSERWPKLVNGFRQEGALLLLVAPRAAPALGELVAITDGVVGIDGTPLPADWRTVGVARPVLPVIPPVAAPAASAAERRQELSATPRHTGRIAAGVVAIALLAVAGVWIGRARPAEEPAAAGQVAVDGTAPSPETAALPPIPVANPEDSAAAAGFAIEVLVANTPEDARLVVSQLAPAAPAATIAPVSYPGDSTQWYKVIVGAYRTRAGADSLLAAMRDRSLILPQWGTPIEAPFALLVQSNVPREAAPGILQELADRGVECYALIQDNETARLYAGAFTAPEQAETLANSLRALGVEPTVVYRTGRTF